MNHTTKPRLTRNQNGANTTSNGDDSIIKHTDKQTVLTRAFVSYHPSKLESLADRFDTLGAVLADIVTIRQEVILWPR